MRTRSILAALSAYVLSASLAVAQCGIDWLPGDGIPGLLGTAWATQCWDPDGAGPAGEVLAATRLANVGVVDRGLSPLSRPQL